MPSFPTSAVLPDFLCVDALFRDETEVHEIRSENRASMDIHGPTIEPDFFLSRGGLNPKPNIPEPKTLYTAWLKDGIGWNPPSPLASEGSESSKPGNPKKTSPNPERKQKMAEEPTGRGV